MPLAILTLSANVARSSFQIPEDGRHSWQLTRPSLAMGTSLAPSGREVSMQDSKPNSDRRIEGEEGAGAHQEGPNSARAGQTQRRGTSAPEQAPKTGRSTKQGNKRSTDGTPNSSKV